METKLPPLSQRIVTTLLAVVMVVGLAPTQAYANTAETSTPPVTVEEDTQTVDENASAQSSQDSISSAIQAVDKTSAIAADQSSATRSFRTRRRRGSSCRSGTTNT